MALSFAQKSVQLDAVAANIDARIKAVAAVVATLNQVKADLASAAAEYDTLVTDIEAAGTGDAALATQTAAKVALVKEFGAITAKVDAAVAALA